MPPPFRHRPHGARRRGGACRCRYHPSIRPLRIQVLVMQFDADVVVAGYGPVGMSLSVLLAQKGHSVVVAERWPRPYQLPRAVHIDHEVARILQSAGVGAELAEISEPVGVYEWHNGEGMPLLRLGRTGAGASAWPQSLMLHQPTLESCLDRRAGSIGVDVRRGMEVTGLTQDQDSVTLTAAGGLSVRARY